MSAVQGGGCNQELKGRCSLIHLQHRKGLMGSCSSLKDVGMQGDGY